MFPMPRSLAAAPRGSPPSAQPPLSLLLLVLASRAPGVVAVGVIGAKAEDTTCNVMASDRCDRGEEVIVGPGYAGVLTRALIHPDHPNKQQRERIARSHSVDHPA